MHILFVLLPLLYAVAASPFLNPEWTPPPKSPIPGVYSQFLPSLPLDVGHVALGNISNLVPKLVYKFKEPDTALIIILSRARDDNTFYVAISPMANEFGPAVSPNGISETLQKGGGLRIFSDAIFKVAPQHLRRALNYGVLSKHEINNIVDTIRHERGVRRGTSSRKRAYT